MARLAAKDRQEIERLRGRFPQTIRVNVSRSADGGFLARIMSYPGCVTEGETFSELIDMVNDAVYTYYEVPRKYLAFMPSYAAPVRLAQDVGVFPSGRVTTDLTLRSIHGLAPRPHG